ncbi:MULTISPECIES: hypothetical protein [Entomomonas]|uniref:Uncharacterized protein n=1 Tax=Entomomonas asaccharolytica TaxID=2785331 RepID=A0A974NHY7_9GAMM|nr:MULTISPECIES: hypothetical protein [Entomomonas]QQP86877.1 hypothetical protein JHT90_06440 [Entomomonas asaccharolytica]UYZ83505.1 hypothetical protein MTZ49_13015 [Entomomonas sp. E2T0]
MQISLFSGYFPPEDDDEEQLKEGPVVKNIVKMDYMITVGLAVWFSNLTDLEIASQQTGWPRDSEELCLIVQEFYDQIVIKDRETDEVTYYERLFIHEN